MSEHEDELFDSIDAHLERVLARLTELADTMVTGVNGCDERFDRIDAKLNRILKHLGR